MLSSTMGEHASLDRTPLQRITEIDNRAPANERQRLHYLSTTTCYYEVQSSPSLSSSYSSRLSSAPVYVQPAACLPSSSSWQGADAGPSSSSGAHVPEQGHVGLQHPRHHHQQEQQKINGRYEYLGLIDELRACAKLKGELVTHPLFNDLMQAHVECLRVGVASSQQLEADDVEDQLTSKLQLILKYAGAEHTQGGRGNPPALLRRTKQEIDVFMENYLQVLMSWRKHFLPPTMDALCVLGEMEQSFRGLTGVTLNFQAKAAPLTLNTEEDMHTDDLSCAFDMDLSRHDVDQVLLQQIRLELKNKLKESYKECITTIHEEILRKRQAGKLCGDITALKRWWDAHSKWPYPTEAEKRMLVKETGLEMRQVNNWLINHRKRNWNNANHHRRQTSTAPAATAAGCSPHANVPARSSQTS